MLTSSQGFSCPFAEVSGHKWAAWNHPDPKGHQYRAVLFALEEFRSRNIPCALLWVDYTSIPQSNVFLQQAAINSLSVYATYSSVFLTLVTDDSNDQEALHSYNQRGWCRLELLSFMACGWSERESYICDGSLGPFTIIPNLHESNSLAADVWLFKTPPRLSDTPQVFVDRPHGHVGGDVLGCARRKFQLLRSKLVGSLCGA